MAIQNIKVGKNESWQSSSSEAMDLVWESDPEIRVNATTEKARVDSFTSGISQTDRRIFFLDHTVRARASVFWSVTKVEPLRPS